MVLTWVVYNTDIDRRRRRTAAALRKSIACPLAAIVNIDLSQYIVLRASEYGKSYSVIGGPANTAR